MSGLYLLDTNVVVALVRGQALGAAIDLRFGLTQAKRRPIISVVTHGEIRVLARRNQWSESRVAALTRALNALVTVDINITSVIDAYVEIDLFSQKYPEGARNMGKNDLWIAACAKAAGATLLTTDKDFEHLTPALLAVMTIDPAAAVRPSPASP